jgi:hypothetical protein
MRPETRDQRPETWAGDILKCLAAIGAILVVSGLVMGGCMNDAEAAPAPAEPRVRVEWAGRMYRLKVSRDCWTWDEVRALERDAAVTCVRILPGQEQTAIDGDWSARVWLMVRCRDGKLIRPTKHTEHTK